MNTGSLKDRLERELERIQEMEEQLSDPAVTGNPSLLRQISREHSRLAPRKEHVQSYLKLLLQLEDAKRLIKEEKTDKELLEIAEAEIEELETKLESEIKEIQSLLIPPDPMSGRPVIFEIRAGTGGDEASLFVSDLLRMYLKYTEKMGFSVERINTQETEMGGIKEVVFSVSGETAYDLLHREAGTHRVQRIPVTESGGRIHTSAVTVAVMPEAEEEEVSIQDQDLRVDVFRASGAGGQHVNKTESAVRLTHIPTGIVVSCQDERSQIKNRSKAMRVLRARIAELQDSESRQKENAIKKEQVGSGDRSERIRTYNFPQGRVTDHRINLTLYNLQSFMEGEMTEVLEALLDDQKESLLAQMD